MTFGLYLLFTLVTLLFFGLWLRRLIVRRLQPERILSDLDAEIQRMVRDINTAGDQNISVLEDRIESLKTLIRRADIQIDEMEQRLREIEAAKEEPPPIEEADPIDDGVTEEEAFTIPFQRDIESPTEAVPEEQREPDGTPRDHIIALHDEGVPSDVIASRMGIAIGEVELIISLATNRPRT